MDLNRLVESNFNTKVDLGGFNENYKQFPRRVIFHRNNKSAYLSHNETPTRSKDNFFDLTSMTARTIEMNDVSKAQAKVEGMPFKYSVQTQRKSQRCRSGLRQRPVSKYCPWDLDSGFGKR